MGGKGRPAGHCSGPLAPGLPARRAPQLFNVLKGDMNIVGPRPERPSIFTELRKSIPHYKYRQRVRPGITGLAQVSRQYDDVPGRRAQEAPVRLRVSPPPESAGGHPHHGQDPPGGALQAGRLVTTLWRRLQSRSPRLRFDSPIIVQRFWRRSRSPFSSANPQYFSSATGGTTQTRDTACCWRLSLSGWRGVADWSGPGRLGQAGP